MNPFFNALQGMMGAQGAPMNNLPKMMQLFSNFRAGFNGNAEQTVRGMLSSGKMSQEQFNQLSQAATMFQQMTGIR